MKYQADLSTDPANYRDGYRKATLQALCEHGELAVYNANAAFGTPGAAFAEPLKLKTLEGHVRYWKWCHLGAGR